MMYKHKKEGIIWDVDPNNRASGTLIKHGGGWTIKDVGYRTNYLNCDSWDSGQWVIVTFNEYLKLL